MYHNQLTVWFLFARCIEMLAFQVVRTDGGVQGLPIVLEALKYASK